MAYEWNGMDTRTQNHKFFQNISLCFPLSSFSRQTWILLQDAVDQGDFEHVSEVVRMGEVRGGRGANAASRMRDPEVSACLRQ
jgi:hypothetical protein